LMNSEGFSSAIDRRGSVAQTVSRIRQTRGHASFNMEGRNLLRPRHNPGEALLGD
jgi:hypothetical protein